MADFQLIIIGGGLSGLAAGIRSARFGLKTLIVEQHHLPGGLNSYYYRRGYLLETGLHAMTNFAPFGDKHAPLNRLFRQLKLSRKTFITHEQTGSAILFPDNTLHFSNELDLLLEEISQNFSGSIDRFRSMVTELKSYDPFADIPWKSAREYLHEHLGNPLLEDMILLPLMVYGNAEEHDMDLGQFAIMFRALFLEGFFRPEGTIKNLLDTLITHFRNFDGNLRFRTSVVKILHDNGKTRGIRLQNGEEITADSIISTVGIPGTALLSNWPLDIKKYTGRMSFMETISYVPKKNLCPEPADQTIIFYNNHSKLNYQRPDSIIDPSWGVICFPDNFKELKHNDPIQVRVTNAANYDIWKEATPAQYKQLKKESADKSSAVIEKIIGNYRQEVVYQDSFTPTTIERYTAKPEGAVYGSPIKIKTGKTHLSNLFIAGTDQGYLGIVGSMLSGVTIVNQHVLL